MNSESGAEDLDWNVVENDWAIVHEVLRRTGQTQTGPKIEHIAAAGRLLEGHSDLSEEIALDGQIIAVLLAAIAEVRRGAVYIVHPDTTTAAAYRRVFSPVCEKLQIPLVALPGDAGRGRQEVIVQGTADEYLAWVSRDEQADTANESGGKSTTTLRLAILLSLRESPAASLGIRFFRKVSTSKLTSLLGGAIASSQARRAVNQRSSSAQPARVADSSATNREARATSGCGEPDATGRQPAASDHLQGLSREEIREGVELGALRRNADGSIEVTELGASILGVAAARRWGGSATDAPAPRDTPKVTSQQPGVAGRPQAFRWEEISYNSDHTSLLAVFALVLAVVFAPAGVLLGILARRSVRRTGKSGYRLATAALAIGLTLTTLGVIVIAVGPELWSTTRADIPVLLEATGPPDRGNVRYFVSDAGQTDRSRAIAHDLGDHQLPYETVVTLKPGQHIFFQVDVPSYGPGQVSTEDFFRYVSWYAQHAAYHCKISQGGTVLSAAQQDGSEYADCRADVGADS